MLRLGQLTLLLLASASFGCGRISFEQASTDGAADTALDTASDAPADARIDGAADATLDSGERDVWCEANHPNAILCDSFNRDEFATHWMWSTGNVTLENTIVAEGSGALRASVNGEPEVANIGTALSPIGQGRVHITFYSYVPSSADITHVSFLSFSEAVEPYDAFALVGHPNDYIDAWSSISGSHNSADNIFPRDQWFCLRFTALIDNVNGGIFGSIDSANIFTVIDIDTLPATGYSHLFIGNTRTQDGQGAANIYIDAFVISNDPIDCVLTLP